MFSRIGRLVRGFFSLFITGLEEANPEALMAAARDDFRAKMVQYNRRSRAWRAWPSGSRAR